MRDIASELAELLEDAGIGLVRPPSPGANLFTAPMPDADGDVPARSVALVVTGGAEPQLYLGLGQAAYLVVHCQVRVRSGREDFQGGQQLALMVFMTLNQSCFRPQAFVQANESWSTYLGDDSSGRHRWMTNLMFRYMAR
ncbi:hypothetical protein [Corallococcus carmarthensis]|uniref:hypothetical protein n=1 Tax=Corallococcus carmarthensis TaxID=2316728 RepID=UPI00148BA51B|nr:hypothetical protein [Corallococcus carmarthensis]NOK20775.1 hypothetical protein [Corallococcus carmarthensis]